MSGNVMERVSSRYWAYPYNPFDGRESEEMLPKALYVLRGGSWLDDQTFTRTVSREINVLNNRHSDVGLRLVVPAAQ